ncbi:MAG: putative DNA binding domain-containing protein [Proteobacteria bacterium]|nr:putative DNA binding domain-containing protein [Pseudomonadota bacterium]MBU4469471.1 putative DNA binding domain-containing protein [Pseudomonadota bacterium]MCG2752372.1 putative DNA binding domain-containing protein [Desulfobacteraceae bacterium]
MTKTELLELIKNLENSGVEFKRDTIDNRAMAKELVAFANFQGGRVILGVDDDGSVVGLTRDRLEEWVMTTCRDKIRPELIPYYEVIRDVEPGKDVAIVQVDRGWAVHHVWHNNHRSWYIRVGTQSREASSEELERLFQQRGTFRLEVRGVSGSSAKDFDYRRLNDYFQRIHSPYQKTPGMDDTEAWQTLLLNTEFLIEENDRKSATIAGLLLFCAKPNRFLPQAGIDAVAYPGKEKDYAAKERLSIRGPMTALFGSAGLVENGLVEQAVEFVRRNTGVVATLADGARREQKWTYPEEAVREAIVNALVHRDYLLSGTTVELSIYEDRLEVISPGRLPNGITPQRMITGCRAARNQLLKDVMRDYGYLEHMGMGVPRKIVKEMQKHNGTLPDLIEDGELFMIRLWNK